MGPSRTLPGMSTMTAFRGGPVTERGGVPDDRALWSRLAGADDAALTELYRRHCDAVYNFAFRRTASWAAAEDVVQATFTAVWRRARSGTVDQLRAEPARAVLLVMAGQECANAARAARRLRLLHGRIEADAGSAVSADQCRLHGGARRRRAADERGAPRPE